MWRALAFTLTLALSACVGAPRDPAPSATGGEIATTTLPPAAAPPAAAPAVAAPPPAAPPAAPGVEPSAPQAAPEALPPEAPAPEPPPPEAPAPAALSAPPPSPQQLVCERRGGSWLRVNPGSDARACVRRTRDAGRRCDAGADCAGDCLARSMTCAPVTPLFGCQEILDDTGRRMMQCIE